MKRWTDKLTSAAIVAPLVLGVADLAGAEPTAEGLVGLDVTPVSDQSLSEERGRQAQRIDYQMANSEQQGVVSGSVLAAENGASINNGRNTLSGTAFSGSKGFASVIQNSGNQVVIQDSTNVNIRYTP